jgi:hypothetical protein
MVNKLIKYRKAIAYLEHTFPIPTPQRQAPVGGRSIEAIRYVMSPTPPTATLDPTSNNFRAASLVTAKSTAQIGLGMTVPEYMQANAASTRVVVIHLGSHQPYMDILFDGTSSVEHMKAVLRTAANAPIHVCILCDPHQRGVGVGTPSPTNAVCADLQGVVSQIPATHIKVANGGANHSAFHDPTYRAWITAPGVTAIVVLGYQADICVRGNVFGISEELVGAIPRRIAPALINFKDVITSKPLLCNDGNSISQFNEWGMAMCSAGFD